MFAFSFPQGDVWICMELMDTSLDKFYKHVIDKGLTIPEDILGKIAVSVSTGRGDVSILNLGCGDLASLPSEPWDELGPQPSPHANSYLASSIWSAVTCLHL